MSNSNEGDGDKGGGQTTVTRAAAMTPASMWAMVMVTKLVGNEEGKGNGGKGKFDSNEGGGHQREQGRQGNGHGNKGGGQVDGNGDNNSNGDEDEGSG